jgi:sulfur carrier protein
VAIEREEIRVKVNGQEQLLPAGCTLRQLLDRLGVPESGTAVELAGEIVPRVRFDSTPLRDGQAVEIVRLVGGG